MNHKTLNHRLIQVGQSAGCCHSKTNLVVFAFARLSNRIHQKLTHSASRQQGSTNNSAKKRTLCFPTEILLITYLLTYLLTIGPTWADILFLAFGRFMHLDWECIMGHFLRIGWSKRKNVSVILLVLSRSTASLWKQKPNKVILTFIRCPQFFQVHCTIPVRYRCDVPTWRWV